MRSNLQLIAGDHYAKRNSKFWNRLRTKSDISNEQKIRLTKNHIRKIVHIYVNSITSYAPGVTAVAKDKKSIQHQKAAELANSVWQDGKHRHDLNLKINQWANDFVGIGEAFVKVFFDPFKGKYLGQEAKIDEMGQVVMGEDGQPVPNGPKFSGDVIIERLFGGNIIRPQNCKDINDAEWLCHKKMVSVYDLKKIIESSDSLDEGDKESIKKKITETQDQTFMVLDGGTGQYKQTKDEAMIKEWFFRPCPKYPNGYFYICTDNDILFEGELPFGIFPIITCGFDEVQTSPRHRSIVKQLRPYQVEVNRTASTIAETQISLGWDKVLVQNGTKLVPGMSFPGVRSFQYSGMAPVVMEGRTGNQYLEYMNSQISEMYSVAMVSEQLEEKQGNFDVYSMLSRSIKDKKKFSLYTDKFESFLKNIYKTYVKLCQQYYSDAHLIPAIGKSEYVNIDEFRGVDDICYRIEIEAQTDDGESKLGKQLMLNHLIQYVGPQLAKDDIGKIIRLMPYAQDEIILDDLTMDFDLAANYILALDRGKDPVPNQYDNHEYLIRKLVNRTRQPDFEFMDPVIKQRYAQYIQLHEQLKTEQEMKIKQAQSEFIPTGGYLVACDFYIPNPDDPTKLPKRVRLPSESLDWLIKQINSQGSDQKTLENLPGGAQAEMAQMFLNQQQQMGANQPLVTGQTSPIGAMYG